MNIQTWKKLIFVRKPIFGVEKCLQIHIVPKHIKEPKIPIFNERKLVLGLQHVKVTVKVKVKVKVQMEKFRNIGVLP